MHQDVEYGGVMNPKTEELLYYLLYFAEMVSQPTWRNLDQSFEGWAYRNGLHRRLAALEARQFIERAPSATVERIYRLTEKGRLHSLGGRDPNSFWDAEWDGTWRMILFDIPRTQNAARDRLRKALLEEGYGCLQHSVWIAPRPLSNRIAELCGQGDDVGTVLTMAGRPGAGEKDADLVARAWNFDRINAQYAAHGRVLKRRPSGSIRDKQAAEAFRRWAAQERITWLEAVEWDPLLPQSLLPPGYKGRPAWTKRKQVLARAAAQLSRSTF